MSQVQPAIPANKIWLLDAALYWFIVRPALWNRFSRVWVQMHGRLPRQSDSPLICYINHPAWWDLYLGVLMHRKLLHQCFDSYGMMEEPQLRAYRFFTWFGGFSVDRHNPREAARSVAYISTLLRERPGRVLYIFPQGKITPNDQRPIHLYTGLGHIVKRAGGATLCPVAFRYEFRGQQNPEAFIRFGPIHYAAPPTDSAAVDALTQDATERLTASADALRAAVVADDLRNFAVLFRGRPGIDQVFDRLRGLVG